MFFRVGMHPDFWGFGGLRMAPGGPVGVIWGPKMIASTSLGLSCSRIYPSGNSVSTYFTELYISRVLKTLHITFVPSPPRPRWYTIASARTDSDDQVVRDVCALKPEPKITFRVSG